MASPRKIPRKQEEAADSVDDTPDPTINDSYKDIILFVDGRPLYTCRSILGPPVWRSMLFGEGFLEQGAREIPLPGKTYEDVLELLLIITPGIQKPVSGRCS